MRIPTVTKPVVMPAKAGIHAEFEWTPAFAGVTGWVRAGASA